MQQEPTVFIVDDDQEVRSALQLLMESIGLKVELYTSSQSFLEHFDNSRPGCLILDIRMPGMSGLELQARLMAESISPAIIIITGHGDVPMAVRAVKAGAIDFIEKPFNEQNLLDSVHRAIAQDALKRGEITQFTDIQERVLTLTPREREVMALVVAGSRNKVIASELGVSQSTIEVHRSRVMEKMQAKTLSELMRMILMLEKAENP